MSTFPFQTTFASACSPRNSTHIRSAGFGLQWRVRKQPFIHFPFMLDGRLVLYCYLIWAIAESHSLQNTCPSWAGGVHNSCSRILWRKQSHDSLTGTPTQPPLYLNLFIRARLMTISPFLFCFFFLRRFYCITISSPIATLCNFPATARFFFLVREKGVRERLLKRVPVSSCMNLIRMATSACDC